MNIISLGKHIHTLEETKISAVTKNINGTILIGKKAEQLKTMVPFLENANLNEWIRKCLAENEDSYISLIHQFTCLFNNAENNYFFLPDEVYQYLSFDEGILNAYPLSSLLLSINNLRAEAETADKLFIYSFSCDEGTYYFQGKKVQNRQVVYISKEYTSEEAFLETLKTILNIEPNQEIVVHPVTLQDLFNVQLEASTINNVCTVLHRTNEERFKNFYSKLEDDWEIRIFDMLSAKWDYFSYTQQVQINNLIAQSRIDKNKKKFADTILDQFILENHNSIKVGVISPFTYGKSTFINSLIHVPLLSEDILVKTASITRISNHKQFLIHNFEQNNVVFNQLEDFSLLKEQLNLLTTDKENQSLTPVRAMLPYKNLEDKIELVDTPGLFGPHSHHDEITENYIKELDVIVYMLDPSQTGFEPYTRKINELQEKYSKPCVFVMNKIDLVPKATDKELVKNEFKNKVLTNFPDCPVFSVSSYFASRARFYRSGLLSLMDIKKDQYVYVKENQEIISGRLINESHIEAIEKQSGIIEFEKYLASIY
ncbi:dynamin family protein [Marinococcus luteus]|uniref:dynamin family protein n=1 Tax=Marinococcus luteus TaxID=1122204 RepID=UPI002ACC997D|nr:dynamin family protein [Marinococcus luteus]MDZ5783377.1 dynamin family protein [Marinococcus luteus]